VARDPSLAALGPVESPPSRCFNPRATTGQAGEPEETMKRIVLGALSAALLAVSADAAELRLLSSWDKSNWPAYAVADTYLKMVNGAPGGKVKIALNGPETVPPFQQIQPVSAGVFDMLYTHGAYHGGSKGIALAADAIDIDPHKRREVGIHDVIDRYYQKHNNLKLVSIPTQSFAGYQMFLKAPLSADEDVKGRKIRGVSSYHGVIRALGGAPVVLPPGEVYSALEKGVIDGACFPAAGLLTTKFYEVAKYALRPTFGSTNAPIFINLDSWKKLAKDEQTVILDNGRRLEFEMPWIGQGIYEQEEAELRKLGMTYIQLSPAKAALVKRTWNESQWALAKDCCADGVDELRDLALKHGMTN
jgi:TRAP-type mannitol/chloroaromatic compound transport system substrate-binding protein